MALLSYEGSMKPRRQMNGPVDMDEQQFKQWTSLLAERTGLHFDAGRRSFLSTNIRIRMRELALDDYQTYRQYLFNGSSGAAEWATLIDRLTVHETRFFRHPSSLVLLTDDFLPRYLQDKPTPIAINVWSVGCATGEEAYSLAITLDQYFRRQQREYYFGITASDISLPALAEARNGIYPIRRLKDVDPSIVQRYFRLHDAECLQVVESLRRRLCYNHLNILDEVDVPLGEMDIIVCQNLLIYYERSVRHRILNKLVAQLRPGGLLLLGHGEALCWHSDEMARLSHPDTLAYVRKPHGIKEADNV